MLNNKFLNVLAILALAANSSSLPQDEGDDDFYKLDEDYEYYSKDWCEYLLEKMLDVNPELLDEITEIDSAAIPISDLCVYKTFNSVETGPFQTLWYKL